MSRPMFISLGVALLLGPWRAGAESYTDDQGYTVQLSRAPARIISLAPSNTELLFALGLGERLVGVTEFCDHPAAAQQIRDVAGYNTLNLERIVAARPQLVVAARGNDAEGLETLRRLDIPVYALDIQSVGQLLDAIQRLGAVTGVPERADSLHQRLAQRVQAVQARLDTVAARPRVMWGYWSEPIYTAGAGTMIDDVLTQAGGINVGRQAPGAWPQVDLETVMAWAPECIITTYHPQSPTPGRLAQDISRLQQTPGWQSVPAVQQGRVHYVEANLLNRPGPRLIDALEQVAAILHGGVSR